MTEKVGLDSFVKEWNEMHHTHRSHRNFVTHQQQQYDYNQGEDSSESGSGMQEVIQMCSSFDATKSTKGASKLRRDLINAEIANLRDLLPLPSSTRQRLSQLQLMALVCVYVRKANYFNQVLKSHGVGHPFTTPNIGFSKSLSGFLIMMTQNGKLLYISDNAAEYLGHSMEDLLIHGDSVYDIIDKADHGTVQAELLRNTSNPSSTGVNQGPGEESRLFLCRMNVSRNARRQMRFGDQKVVLLQGRYLSYLPLCSRNEPVFIGSCTPVAMPETRECVVQGATNVFTSIHAMDMKFMHIDRNGEHYLGYSRQELGGVSWYQLVHWNYMREAQSKHRLISQSEQEKSCILLLRMETRGGEWVWVHCVLQVKDGTDSNSSSQPHPTQSIIVATNQVLSEREAGVMRANSWLYHYYTVQTKLQYGLAYPDPAAVPPVGVGGSSAVAAAAAASAQLQLQSSAAARLAAAAAYFPSAYEASYHAHHHHHPQIQQGLTSPLPHNGNGYPYPHHPHYHPQFEGGVKGKESPLDFSLTSSTSAFDPYTPYWSHHSHHQSSAGHNPSSQYHYHATTPQSHYYSLNTSSSTKSESSVSPSATSPQTWSLSVSSTKGSQVHISTTSPNNSSSNTSSGGPRKKLKKNSNHSSASQQVSNNSEIIAEPVSASPPLARRSTFSDSAGNSVGVIAATSIPSYHAHNLRNRNMYKLLGTFEEGGAREENIQQIMACPLTPSPIWEGQTQRVPDLQFGNVQISGGSNSGSSSGTEREYSGGLNITGNSSELIHCVPTYLPYGSGSSNPSTTSAHFPFQGYTIQGGPYTYGFPIPTAHPHYLQIGESNSPNKENRLPPTPESDNGENEENKPIKWESL